MKVKALDEIKSCLQPIADALALEIWEVEFKQGHSPALTVYIDTETGVDLDTCEKFHRAIDPILDEFDPTYGARPLRRAIQRMVEDDLSEEILSGRVKLGDKVSMKMGENGLVFSSEA